MRSLSTTMLLCVLSAPTFAYELQLDSEGHSVKWVAPVSFVLDAQAAIQLKVPNVQQAIQDSLNVAKSELPSLSFSLRTGTTGEVGYNFSNPRESFSEITVAEEWPYRPGVLASTVLSLDRSKHTILEADVVFNAQENTFGVVDRLIARNDVNDVQNTMVHELGHALGLAHNEDAPQVVMFPEARVGETNKRHFAQDDLDGLHALYAAEPSPTNGSLSTVSSTGCSTSPVTMALFVLPLLLLARRGRARTMALASVLALPGLALADGQRFHPTSLCRGTVVGKQAFAPTNGKGIIETELTIRIEGCQLGASTPTELRVKVPGGTIGSIEQVVVHQPVPQHGESVMVVSDSRRSYVYRVNDAFDMRQLSQLMAQTTTAPSVTVPSGSAGAVVR